MPLFLAPNRFDAARVELASRLALQVVRPRASLSFYMKLPPKGCYWRCFNIRCGRMPLSLRPCRLYETPTETLVLAAFQCSLWPDAISRSGRAGLYGYQYPLPPGSLNNRTSVVRLPAVQTYRDRFYPVVCANGGPPKHIYIFPAV